MAKLYCGATGGTCTGGNGSGGSYAHVCVTCSKPFSA